MEFPDNRSRRITKLIMLEISDSIDEVKRSKVFSDIYYTLYSSDVDNPFRSLTNSIAVMKTPALGPSTCDLSRVEAEYIAEKLSKREIGVVRDGRILIDGSNLSMAALMAAIQTEPIDINSLDVLMERTKLNCYNEEITPPKDFNCSQPSKQKKVRLKNNRKKKNRRK